MSNPLITVIIPAYNRPNYLRMCLDSVKRQRISDIEVIVGDDGSDKDVKFVAEESGAIFVTGEHVGHPSVARNRALSKAKGRYLVFVDDDDMLVPGSILSRLQYINENCFVCGAAAELTGSYGYDDACQLLRDGKMRGMNTHIADNEKPWESVHSVTVMAPLSLVERYGLFDEHPDLVRGQDKEVWARWCKQGVTPVHCGQVVVFYRAHKNNHSYFEEEDEKVRKEEYRSKAIAMRAEEITFGNTLLLEVPSQ